MVEPIAGSKVEAVAMAAFEKNVRRDDDDFGVNAFRMSTFLDLDSVLMCSVE